MNCQNHPEIAATAYCRTCGKPVCDGCRRDAYGTVFCAEHAPAPAAAPGAASSPPPPVPRATVGARPAGGVLTDVSPGLAFALGWIPGVGAIYNGQYAKGIVHAVVFGILCSILDSNLHGLDVIFAMMLTAWIFYMAFEAYHTASKRRAGEYVDEYSSLIDFRSHGRFPVAGVALILLGVILLLHTLDILDFYYVSRYWPALLIVAGLWLLYNRFAGADPAPKEIGHERK
jgi:TM2 domain-containing membrane protein YozV